MYVVKLLLAVAVAGTPEDKHEQFHHTEFKVGILLDTSTEDSISWSVEEALQRRSLVNVSVSNTKLVWRRVEAGGIVLAVRSVCDLLNSGIHMLVTAVRCPQLMTVSAMTETFRIPHLAVGIDPCVLPDSTFTIHRPHPRRYAGIVLRDTVRTLGWKKLALISNPGSTNKLVIDGISLDGVDTVFRTTDSLKMGNWPRGLNNMVVITPLNELPHLLHVLKTFRSRDAAYRLILLTTEEITEFTWNQIRSHVSRDALLLEPMNRLTDTLTAAMYAFSDVTSFGNRTSDAKCGTEENVVVPWTTGVTGNIEKNRRIYGCDKAMECGLVEYRLAIINNDNGEWPRTVGKWTPALGLNLTHHARTIFQNNDHDFGGRTLRVGVVNHVPYSFKDENNTRYAGFVIDMLNDMAAVLNFRYQIVESVDGLYGHRLDNGSWTGAIGMAQRHEIDMAAGFFTVTAERVRAVDFSRPLIQDGLSIITPRPVETVDQFQVFRPFSLEVWIAIVGSILIVTFLLTFLDRCSSQHVEGQSFYVAFFVVISSYFEQGSGSRLTATSARCLLGVWLVFSLLTMSFYTAVLVSVLTVSTPARPINSLEDLAERNDMGVLITYGSSVWDLFQNSDHPVYKSIKSKITPSDLVEQALPSVYSGKYSLIADRSSLLYQVSKNCAKTRLATETFQSTSSAFVLPKHSPYKVGIDTSIQKMVETGWIVKLENRWLAAPKICPKDTRKPRTMLDFDRMRGIFFVFCGVAVFSAICFLGECFFKKITGDICTFEQPSHEGKISNN